MKTELANTWTTTPRKDTGLGLWEPLVTRFLSADKHTALFYTLVSLIKDTLFHIDCFITLASAHVCVCVCVCVCVLHCSVMSDSLQPWTVACQAPLLVEFPRQEYWSGLPFPPPGDLPNPGLKLMPRVSPASAGRLLFTTTAWEALHICLHKARQAFLRSGGLSITSLQLGGHGNEITNNMHNILKNMVEVECEQDTCLLGESCDQKAECCLVQLQLGTWVWWSRKNKRTEEVISKLWNPWIMRTDPFLLWLFQSPICTQDCIGYLGMLFYLILSTILW